MIIRIVVIVRLSRLIRILVVSASYRRLSQKLPLSRPTTVPFPLSFPVLV